MVEDSVLTTAEGLVNRRLFTPIVTFPEKVVAGRVVGVTVSQVLYLVYRASNITLSMVCVTPEVLMKFML